MADFGGAKEVEYTIQYGHNDLIRVWVECIRERALTHPPATAADGERRSSARLACVLPHLAAAVAHLFRVTIAAQF